MGAVYCGHDIIERHIVATYIQLEKDVALLQEWIRVGKEENHCVVCGREINKVSVQRMLRRNLWCSRECFELKPGKIIDLEQEFGMNIVDVLKYTTKKYGSIEAQCNALDVSIPYFYKIIRRYCGPNYLKFLADNAVGKRKETYLKKVNRT